jgi:hypothetical protein
MSATNIAATATKPPKAEEPVFRLADVTARIVDLHQRHLIASLTSQQKDEVINALADRQIAIRRSHEKETNEMAEHLEWQTLELSHTYDKRDEFRKQVVERDMEIIKLKEKEKESNTLRDHFLYKNAANTEEKEQATASRDEPPTPSQVSEFGDSQMVTSTPLPSAQRPHKTAPRSAQQPVANNTDRGSSTPSRNKLAETPKPNLLRRAFGLLSSPFGTIRKFSTGAQAQRPSQLQNGESQNNAQQPLGALPESRKRSAPEPEPELPQENGSQRLSFSAPSTFTPAHNKPWKTIGTPRSARGGPSIHDHTYPSPLGAISEYTEPSETNMQPPQPTPSRPRTTPARHRDIASVRRQRELASRVEIPKRAWDYTPIPRDPNADSRLAKLQKYHETKDGLQEMEKDAEIKEMVQPRIKRVKVDDLVTIPHNRPGDPSSMFRVYDADTDDEMEVEESWEVRENVFEEDESTNEKQNDTSTEQTAAQTQQIPQSQPAQTPQQPQEPVQEEEEIPEGVELMTFDFPDIGKRDPNEGPSDPLGATKFAFGFVHWKRTGQCLNWLWEQDGWGDMGEMAL